MKSFSPIHEPKSAIRIRPAHPYDASFEVATLLYDTDPYIYPYWFGGNRDLGLQTLSGLFTTPGNIFYYENIIVAEDVSERKIVGALCHLEHDTPLDFDYRQISTTAGTEKVYTEYFDWLKSEAQAASPSTLIVSNLCTDSNRRGHGIGHRLFGAFVDQADQQGYDRIEFDCLADNAAAINLYESFGCKIIRHGKGFGGDRPAPDVVDFVRTRP